MARMPFRFWGPAPSPAEITDPVRSPQYKDEMQESMTENSAMVAVDKLWEAEYSDIPTDLDSILVSALNHINICLTTLID